MENMSTRASRPASRSPWLEEYRAVDDPKAVILLAHGGSAWGHGRPHRARLAYLRMLPFSRLWNRQDHGDVAVWRLRYRHRGWNGEDCDPVQDLNWALEHTERSCRGATVLVGHSMGGRAALWAGGAAHVSAVCALAPWIEASDPVAQLRGRRLLLAHGEDDQVTDPRQTEAFAARAAEYGVDAESVRLERTGHAMLARRKSWESLTAQFVDAALSLPRPDGGW